MPPKSIFKKYRLLPLIGVGLLILVALTLLSVLIWSLAAYSGQQDPSQSGSLALWLYLGAVFVSCAAMTLLIRGGTVFPALAVGLAAAVVSLLLAPIPAGLGKILLKLIVTLLVAVAGFALTKLACIFVFPMKKQPPGEEKRDSLSHWEEADAISEPE